MTTPATSITHTPGRIVWRDLQAHDARVAATFYGELFGWRFHDMSSAEQTYMVAINHDAPVCGIQQQAVGTVSDSHWLGFVSVWDVDAASRRAFEGGGTVLLSPAQIPGLGRYAVVADPLGGELALVFSQTGDPPVPTNIPVGAFCWDTLVTPEPDAGVAFYTDLVGWTCAHTPGGVRAFLTGTREDAHVVEVAPQVPCHWVSYVRVDDLDATRERATALGGHVVAERIEVPGQGAFTVLGDPQGAFFCAFMPA